MKHTTDPMEKANLKLALDAMKVSIYGSEVFVCWWLEWWLRIVFPGGDHVLHNISNTFSQLPVSFVCHGK